MNRIKKKNHCISIALSRFSIKPMFQTCCSLFQDESRQTSQNHIIITGKETTVFTDVFYNNFFNARAVFYKKNCTGIERFALIIQFKTLLFKITINNYRLGVSP